MIGDIPLNLSPIALILTVTVVFVAAFVRGYAGFGFSALLMVGLLPVVPAAQLVPMSIALEILASSSQARRILPDVNRRILAILLFASLIGAPIGVYMLSYFSERTLQFIVYGFILASTSLLLLLRPRPLNISKPSLFVAGLVSGVVNGATALSGLVLALFFTSSTVSSRTIRATMIAYLFFTDIITGGFLLADNRYDAQTIWRTVVTIPFLLAGVWLGSRQFIMTPSESFKTLVMWLLMVFGAAGLIRLL